MSDISSYVDEILVHGKEDKTSVSNYISELLKNIDNINKNIIEKLFTHPGKLAYKIKTNYIFLSTIIKELNNEYLQLILETFSKEEFKDTSFNGKYQL